MAAAREPVLRGPESRPPWPPCRPSEARELLVDDAICSYAVFMRRASSNLMIAAGLSVLLMLVPILHACFPYDETIRGLAKPAALLLLPAAAAIRPFDSAPDLPLLVFVNWLLYSIVLRPVVAAFRRTR